MTKSNFIRSKSAFAAVLFVCVSAFNSFAQTAANQPQSEPNYEIVLQVLSASNDANDRSAEAVPQSLSNVVKKLKTIYSYSIYRLKLTYFQRVANAGGLEFKGVLVDPNQDVFTPVFSDFTFGRLLTLNDAADSGKTISIENFRFGQRVPIKTATAPDDGGKSHSVINYEQVGLTMRQIGLPLNTPTIIGNLSAAKPDELSFLVLTVKPAE